MDLRVPGAQGRDTHLMQPCTSAPKFSVKHPGQFQHLAAAAANTGALNPLMPSLDPH